MGVAYYPSLEKKIDGFEPSTAVSGKPIARAMKQLDKICEQIDVKPLMSFYSESLKETFDKIGEAVPPGMRDEGICWYEPAEGLRTIRALFAYLQSHPDELAETARLIKDLEGFQDVLIKAAEHKTRFRLRIDV